MVLVNKLVFAEPKTLHYLNAETEYAQVCTHPVSRVSHEATGQPKETISILLQ